MTTLTASPNRKFILNKNVNADSLSDIIKGILDINEYDDNQENVQKDYEREPIKLVVDSFGGNIYCGMALVNVILTSETPVYTYCYGKAMSMGLLIFSVGHKRFAHPLATFMHHQLSGNSSGKFMDIVEDVEQKTKLQNILDGLLVSKTKIDERVILEYRKSKTDWYFLGNEGYKMGLVDELLVDKNKK